MPYKDLQKGVSKYLNACGGDQFKACNAISKVSKYLLNKFDMYDGCEALLWAITGHPSVSVYERAKQKMNVTVPKTPYMKNLLGYVSDYDIVRCVEESFLQSVRIGSLTFYYPVHISRESKSRVRVLTRMCWFNK